MRLISWDSAGLLMRLAQILHLHGSRAVWWQQHGARLIDALVISGTAIVLTLACALAWRFTGPRRTQSAFAGGLLVAVFGLSSLVYATVSLPNLVPNSNRLLQSLPRFSGPIYADAGTANILTYLTHYHLRRVQSEVALGHPIIDNLLVHHRGCIVINQPQLDMLQADGVPSSATAYHLLQNHPPGWHVVLQFAAEQNPLEYVGVLCAH
ncbi:MAG TPA: hypothetical protein VF898_14700 [Chloroflexota bacterium]